MNHLFGKKEDVFPTLKQSTPADEQITKKQTIVENYNITNGKELTMCLENDVLILTDIIQNFTASCKSAYGLTSLFCYSTPVLHGKLVWNTLEWKLICNQRQTHNFIGKKTGEVVLQL